MLFSRIFFLTTLLCAITSCELIEDALPEITVAAQGAPLTFTLPATEEATTYDLEIQDIQSEVIRKLDEEDISTDRVAAVRLNNARVQITTANAGFDFGDVTRIVLSISAPQLPELTVAVRETDLTGTSLSLMVTDEGLLDYLLAPTSNFKLGVTTTAPLPQPIDLSVTPEFGITARPL